MKSLVLLLTCKEILSDLADDEKRLPNLTILELLLATVVGQQELEIWHEFSTEGSFAPQRVFNSV